MTTGRPTLYSPKHGKAVIGYLRKGYSITAAAGKIGVSRQTLYEWASVHPDFSDALNKGRAAAAAWWEERLQAIVQGEDGNATAAIFGLKNRAASEWRETTRQEHTGADGGPIETKELSADDAARRIAYLMARGIQGETQDG